MKNKKNINLDNFILPTYNRNNIEFIGGKSATLIDFDKKTYIDFLSGIGVNSLGYDNKIVKNAVKQALKSPMHVSNLFQIRSQAELGAEIQSKSFPGKTFFCNSGTEANEAAYKFSMKYGKTISPTKTEIVSVRDSFHGRTMGALSFTAQPKYQNAFAPFPGNVKEIVQNDISSLTIINQNTAAVFLEMIQGESGVKPLTPAFFKAVQETCKKNNALLIIDEVQSGCSRTGKVFSFQHYEGEVDGFTLAKGLGGGVPIGAFNVQEKYANILSAGEHGTTFGGNPFVTTVALAVFKELSSPKFLEEISKKSLLFFNKLEAFKSDFSCITEVRGKGLMLGIQFQEGSVSTTKIVKTALEKGLVANSINDQIIRMLPPLVITEKEITKGLSILHESIKEHL